MRRLRSPAGCGRSTSAGGHAPNAQSDRSATYRVPEPRAPKRAAELKQHATESLDGSTRRSLPAMHAIENEDPDRHPIGSGSPEGSRPYQREGLQRRLSGTSDAPLDQAVSRVPDAIRYTFEYSGELATLRVSGQTSDALKMKAFSVAQSMECVVEGSVQGNQQPVDRSGERPAVRSTVPHPRQLRGQAAHASCLRTAPNPDEPDKFERDRSGELFEEGRRTCRSTRCSRHSRLPVRGGEMPDQVTYYAVVDDLSSRRQPAGILSARLLRVRRSAR